MARATKGGTEFDPAALDRTEAHFWRGIWDSVPTAVAVEHGVRRAQFGPIQANIVTALPTVPMLNLILDAAAGDAAEEGFLGEAIAWARSQGARVCAPVTPGEPGTERASKVLEAAGFTPIPGWMKFVRDPHPPRFKVAADVEVVEVEPDTAGKPGAPPFAAIAATAFELPAPAAELFAGLPGSPGWRCYVAKIDGEPQACAATFLDGEIAELGIGGTLEGGRRRGCQLALLRRRIEDATAAGARALFVETGARVPGHPSSSYANILRAGFEEAYLCPGWIDARPAAD